MTHQKIGSRTGIVSNKFLYDSIRQVFFVFFQLSVSSVLTGRDTIWTESIDKRTAPEATLIWLNLSSLSVFMEIVSWQNQIYVRITLSSLRLLQTAETSWQVILNHAVPQLFQLHLLCSMVPVFLWQNATMVVRLAIGLGTAGLPSGPSRYCQTFPVWIGMQPTC